MGNFIFSGGSAPIPPACARKTNILAKGTDPQLCHIPKFPPKLVQSALKSSGIDDSTQLTIFKILSVILHLGQIEFASVDNNECTLKSKKDQNLIKLIANLLEIDENLFLASLISRKIQAGLGEKITKFHSQDVAEFGVKSLAKAIYEKLFINIVNLINQKIQVERAVDRDTSIGVLDIYGFEILGKNGFEQFCINYCNEKLQQLFIQLVLKQEQEEYKRENIKWIDIKYFDNEKICKLIEGPLLGTLDDMKLRKGSDLELDRMLVAEWDKNGQANVANSSYSSRQTERANKQLDQFDDFQIKA